VSSFHRCTVSWSWASCFTSFFAKGSAAFQIWADGKLVAQTGVLTHADPPQQLTVDVTGDSLVKLVVTDAADGNLNDSADWAGAQVTCG